MTVGAAQLPFSAACERNKRPMATALKAIFDQPGTVLEIGSGTGQHAVYLARHLPHLTWQPSDLPANLPAIAARQAQAGLPNLVVPVALDVREGPWPVSALVGIFAANVTHIMSWSAVQAFLAAAGRLLPSGSLAIYGPFNDEGRFTSAGNEALDGWARASFPGGGLRDLKAVTTEALRHGLRLESRQSMPANNLLLHFVASGQASS